MDTWAPRGGGGGGLASRPRRKTRDVGSVLGLKHGGGLNKKPTATTTITTTSMTTTTTISISSETAAERGNKSHLAANVSPPPRYSWARVGQSRSTPWQTYLRALNPTPSLSDTTVYGGARSYLQLAFLAPEQSDEETLGLSYC